MLSRNWGKTKLVIVRITTQTSGQVMQTAFLKQKIHPLDQWCSWGQKKIVNQHLASHYCISKHYHSVRLRQYRSSTGLNLSTLARGTVCCNLTSQSWSASGRQCHTEIKVTLLLLRLLLVSTETWDFVSWGIHLGCGTWEKSSSILWLWII